MEYSSRSWNKKYKVVIRCPDCNARHYPTRLDNKSLADNGAYMVHCGCGLNYWVLDKDKDLVIRRYRNGE